MEFLKNLKIGSRLAVGFGVVLFLLAGMALVASIQANKLKENAAFYDINIVPSLKIIHKVSLAVSTMRRNESQFANATTEKDINDAVTKMAKSRDALQAGIKSYESMIADDEDKKNLEAVKASSTTYLAAHEKVRAAVLRPLSDANRLADSQKAYADSRDAYADFNKAVEDWWNYNEKLSSDYTAVAKSTYSSALIWLGAFFVAALLIGISAALFITKSITHPITVAVDLAEKVAKGDLTASISVTGKDETAQLLRALADMNASLGQIVGQVRLSSDSIATGSTQIAVGNTDLSQRTEEQASNLQQTAASMEEITSTVKNNAETAQQASQLATSASDAASKGGEVVGQVVNTMQEISASSQKISDIISVIDSIAFQTNILALNAAVEAARAGEQGRGFAVVASEVRSLAQRSAEAAKEIKTLILASVEKVNDGSRQVGNAGSAMNEIVLQVKRVSDLISEISASTNEQAKGITQVGDAVQQLDEVTQQNAALVEESAAAAESLKHQADTLAQAVSTFKLAHA